MSEEDLETAHSAVVRTIKGLSLSAIRKANSGHTSFPLAMADIGYSLFFNQMKYYPNDPKWLNRDRLILSAGHGSMFLYSFLHLMGYPYTINDLKNFRQLNSQTPGHPEFSERFPGVECTTGPLGQGVANAVGMAISEAHLAKQFNTNFKVFDHYVFCLCGDGDLMEGVAQEAVSLAGHLKLKKLILIYDFNRITIDGTTDITYSENVAAKYRALGWMVLEIDGHSIDEIDSAIAISKVSNRPTLIIAQTIAGQGALGWEGTNKIHGNPMSSEDYEESLRTLGLGDFEVPDNVYEVAQNRVTNLEKEYFKWRLGFKLWANKNPELVNKLHLMVSGGQISFSKLAETLRQEMGDGTLATRVISGKVLNFAKGVFPSLVGGSADLAGSNNTIMDGHDFMITGDCSGSNIHFGIREHAMGAIANGMAYYGVLRPYVATFLVFSDYLRPAIRLAALSHLPVIYVFTHDSFYVGEDGPTHHPVEQISSLRLIPNLLVIRPGTVQEVVEAWEIALNSRKTPVVLCLTRQKLLKEVSTDVPVNKLRFGAYIYQEGANVDCNVIASGSELLLAVEAVRSLPPELSERIRIISMPSTNLFDLQDPKYIEQILPPHIKKNVFIEAGKSDLLWKYVGLSGHIISLDHFSKSAPAEDLAQDFGFTVENVRKEIASYLRS